MMSLQLVAFIPALIPVHVIICLEIDSEASDAKTSLYDYFLSYITAFLRSNIFVETFCKFFFF